MSFLRNIKDGLGNLITWFRIIWSDHDWDHVFLFQILEFKLRRMSEYHKNHGHLLKSSKTSKDLLIASELCKRIYDGDYGQYEMPGYAPEIGPWLYYGNKKSNGEFHQEKRKFYSEYMIKQDLQVLSKLIEFKSRGWWD